MAQTANADKEEDKVQVDLREPCTVTFAIKYLNTFAKAAPLSPQVTLSLSNDVPIGKKLQTQIVFIICIVFISVYFISTVLFVFYPFCDKIEFVFFMI